MTNDIVSAVSNFLTPELMGKMASAAGLDRSLADPAISAVVPSILGGLANLAGKPGGARQLANAVSNQPSDVLDTLTKGLSGSAQLAQSGGNLLSSLLGSGALSMLASTVARFLGVGEGATKTLMGLIAPVIIGMIGKQQRASGLDADGLARMLLGQKDKIAAAMPPGLSNMLDANNVYEGIISPRVTSSTPYASRPETTHVASSGSAGSARSTGVSWMYWALPALVLAGLLWYLISSPGNQPEPIKTAQPADQSSPSVTGSTPNTIYLAQVPSNWVSIGNAANDYVNKDIQNRAGETLGTVKDVLVDSDGQIVAAIISVGRALGIGEKDIAVPISRLRLEDAGGIRHVVVDTTKTALESAPAFTRNSPGR